MKFCKIYKLNKLCSSSKILRLDQRFCSRALSLEKKTTETLECKTIEDMPGPKVWPFIGTSWIFSFLGHYEKEDAVTSAREDMLLKYGPIYKERLKGTNLVSLHSPSDIEMVMKNQGKHPLRIVNEANIYWRRSQPKIYTTIGLVDSNGEEWYDVRMKVAPPLLKAGELIGQTEQFSQIADEFLTCVEMGKKNGGGTDVREYLYRYALEGIWKSCLGLRLGALEVSPSAEAKMLINLSMVLFDSFAYLSTARQWWKLWSTPRYKRFCHAEDTIHKIIDEYTQNIMEADERATNSTHISGTSLLKRYLDNPKFSKQDVNIVIIDFVIAGITTTSHFLSLLLHRLSQEEEIQNRIYKELKSLNLETNSVITDDLLNKMTFLKAVLREGFRLTTIIPGILKCLSKEITVQGYTIPPFTPLMCQTRAAGLNGDYFASPLEFIPDRWYTDGLSTLEDKEIVKLQEQAQKNRFLIIPFGFGSRMCVGRKLVEKEILVLLTKIFLKYKIASDGDLKVVNSFIIAPKSKVEIKFIER